MQEITADRTPALVAEALAGRGAKAEIARVLGVSQNWVNRRISGEVPFRIPELQAIAAHLDVPVDTLINGTDKAAS